MMEPISTGVWGDMYEGTSFNHTGYDGIKMIMIFSGWVVDSIKIQYTKRGKLEWTDRVGGDGGDYYVIVLDPDEYLEAVKGYYGDALGCDTITSLTFYSNLKNYGPFGIKNGTIDPNVTKNGTPFQVGGGKIVGFHGSADRFLSSIGFYIVPIIRPPLSNRCYICGSPKQSSEIQELTPCDIGPWGGTRGQPWDDGVFNGIKQIVLCSVRNEIHSIKIEYDRNGQSFWSRLRGSEEEMDTVQIQFDHPNESLTRITGYHAPLDSNQSFPAIRSLTFHTEERVCGPFGEENGQLFSSPTVPGKIIGFFGRSSTHLDAIGVHMMYL